MNRRLDLIDPDLMGIIRDITSAVLPWPLYIHGQAGRGKTRAALALADVALSARYYTVEGLADQIMAAGRGQTWEPFEDRDSGLRYTDLAILDEIGERGRPGDLHYQAVKRFTDCREFHAYSVAVFISNLSPAELAGLFDDRIASRLTAGTVFELRGEDRRGS